MLKQGEKKESAYTFEGPRKVLERYLEGPDGDYRILFAQQGNFAL